MIFILMSNFSKGDLIATLQITLTHQSRSQKFISKSVFSPPLSSLPFLYFLPSLCPPFPFAAKRPPKIQPGGLREPTAPSANAAYSVYLELVTSNVVLFLFNKICD